MEQHLEKFGEQLASKVTETSNQLADHINELHKHTEINTSLKRKIEHIKIQTAFLNKTINP
jgi:predicted small metal-binding protein